MYVDEEELGTAAGVVRDVLTVPANTSIAEEWDGENTIRLTTTYGLTAEVMPHWNPFQMGSVTLKWAHGKRTFTYSALEVDDAFSVIRCIQTLTGHNESVVPSDDDWQMFCWVTDRSHWERSWEKHIPLPAIIRTKQAKVILQRTNCSKEFVLEAAMHGDQKVTPQAVVHPKCDVEHVNFAASKYAPAFVAAWNARRHDLTPDTIFVAMTKASVRALFAEQLDCPVEWLVAWATDPSREVLRTVAAHPNTPTAVLGVLADTMDERTLANVLANPSCPTDVLTRCALQTVVPGLRMRALQNPSCPQKVRVLAAVTSPF